VRIVFATANLGYAVVVEAALSFLDVHFVNPSSVFSRHRE
jgi:ABC-type dipeptide/oligopeptide/nickel transport system permease subunit